MKKLLLIPLLASLTGCVSYYYPYAAPVDDYVVDENTAEIYEEIFYEEDEPDLIDISGSYDVALYYPWWSVDYFYLGSHYRHSSFSLGFNYGFMSPWQDPYWGYYSPYDSYFYPSRYSFWRNDFGRYFFGWNDYYWRHRYNSYHRYNHHDLDRYAGYNGNRDGDGNRHDDRRDDRRGTHDRDRGNNRDAPYNEREPLRDQGQYAGNDRNRDRNRRRGEDGRIPPGAEIRDPARGGKSGRGEEAPVSRHVSVAGGAQNSNRGIEIRNRSERKPLRARTEPVGSASTAPIRIVADTPRTRSPVRGSDRNSSRGSAGEVRSYSSVKNRKTRTEPVRTDPPTRTVNSVTSGTSRIVSSQGRSSQIRSRAGSKSRTTRPQPSRPQPVSPARQSPQVTSRQRSSTAVRSSQRPAPVQRSAPVQSSGRAQYSPPARSQQSVQPRVQRSNPPARVQRSAPARPSAKGKAPSKGNRKDNRSNARGKKKD